MIKLKQLIELNFGNGKDQDRPSGSKLVALFNPDDEYKIQGKTHGLTSHAIKHLSEFRPDVIDKALRIVANKLSNSDITYKNRKGRVVKELPPQANLQKIAHNTLDFVNDKIMKGETLTDEEQFISKILSTLSKIYEAEINRVVDGSNDIEHIKSNEDFVEAVKSNTLVSFTGNYRGAPITYYIDLKSGFGVFENSEGKVKTAFVLGNASHKSVSEKLKHFFSDSQKSINNPIISKLLGL